MKFGHWLALVLFATGCATKTVHNTGVPTDTANSNMDSGMKAMQRGDYSEAIRIFNKMMMQKPASEFDLLVLYNNGVAHEGIGDCKRATELYRQSASGASALKASRVEAESFYRLSLAYECLGDDKKTIASLLDTKRRAKNLPPDVGQAELPARLAAAYARVGQKDKALQYFREAGAGLKVALAQAGTTSLIKQQFAARTLYAMGQLNSMQKGLNSEPNAFLSSLSMQQPYLLQSAELNVQPESRKAADELIFAYENLMKLKPSTNAEAQQFLKLALKNIAEIKKIRLPNKGPMVDQIYDKVDEQESRIRQMLVTQSDSTPLTNEAKNREGIKRDGRVVSPATPLEKQKRKKQ